MDATDLRKFFRELFGLFLLFWALLLLLALFSFDANDPSFNLVKSGPTEVQNKAGLFGAYAAGFLNDLFGIVALLWPLLFAALGITYISSRYTMRWWRWCGFFLLTLCLLVVSSSADFSIGDLFGGGMVGTSLHVNSRRYLSPAGSFLLWFFVFLIGLQLACNFSWISLVSRLTAFLGEKARGTTKNPAGTAMPLPWLKEHLSSLGNRFRVKENAGKLASILASTRNKLKMPDIKWPASATDSPETSQFRQADDSGFKEPASSPDVECDSTAIMPPTQLAENEHVSAPEDAPDTGCEKDEVEEEDNLPEQVVAMEKSPVIDAVLPRSNAPESLRLFHEHSSEPLQLPSADLLVAPAPGIAVAQNILREKGQILMSCLKDFDITGELVRITPGPVVTMYEVRPARGIRVSKIANLADDLSLALKATTVRIQAPIPGSDTVGVEIPNEAREIVNFRELLESPPFSNGSGPLTMILGKDIAGRPYMAELTKMPHLLIAGATGAGKSVCLNTILVSLLYRAQPSDMRLLLIDPKRMEMAAYADLPHLVHPVVTEMDDAKNALDWAVHEMQNRNRLIPKLNVRNVAAYNQKLAALGPDLPPELADLKPLPYIVIVIDELADLMMTASREVETSIVRLAQLARAAGIHMILATQRPSVDVVTGLIKANFPCRISFQVSSKHDSRTILDQMGAEHLLGRGDMLFKPSGGRLIRLHGPFLSDEEVQKVADHWKSQQNPQYDIDFSQWTAPGTQSASVGGDATTDALYEDARAFVLEQGRASISLLQRHLRIGFNRAARLMEQFERDGLIGPADGSKPRNVVR